MIIAQITDTHIQRPGRKYQFFIDTARYFRNVVAEVNALAPDVVLLTGDIADKGDRREYAVVKAILADLHAPYFLIPGNHDKREALIDGLAHQPYLPSGGRPMCYTVDAFPLRLVAVDSTQPRHQGGFFDASRLAWLEATLSDQPERPTLLFMHHPPMRTGIIFLDRFGFHNLDAFKAIVSSHKQIVRIICGHVHRETLRPWNGTFVSTAISASPKFVPEVFDRKRFGYSIDPPGFALHSWESARLSTRTVVTQSASGR